MVTIGMARCGLGVEGSKVVAEMVSGMASITVVDLRYNDLDTKSATMLATIAKEKKISLCGITPTQSASVRWFATHGLIRTRVLLDFVPKHYFDGPFMGPGDAILLTADLAVRTLANISLVSCGLKPGVGSDFVLLMSDFPDCQHAVCSWAGAEVCVEGRWGVEWCGWRRCPSHAVHAFDHMPEPLLLHVLCC